MTQHISENYFKQSAEQLATTSFDPIETKRRDARLQQCEPQGATLR